jgi:maltooligosyltrehalose synthase
VLTGRRWEGAAALPLADVLEELPVALLLADAD